MADRFPLERPSFVLLLFFAAVVLFQIAGGVYHAEFGDHPDEAAHYVTGLMVRDYVAGLAPVPPMEYAENYYLHYPKVALGHWPPLFYVVQAAWTLVFTPSRISVMLLMGWITALLAYALYRVVRSEFSAPAGIAAGLLMVSLPMIQYHSGLVMAEPLLALLTFGSMLSFTRYMETERWQDASWFGLLSSLAILTKATALCLALVPPLAVLFSRRFHLLARASFWLPAGIVAAFAGSWYWYVAHGLGHSVVRAGYLGYDKLSHQYVQIAGAFGLALLAVMAVGFAGRVVAPLLTRRPADPLWAAAAALVIGFLVFRAWVQAARELRQVITIVPVLVLFLVAGVAWLAPRLPLPRLSVGRRAAALGALLAVLFAWEAFTVPQRHGWGFTEVAEDLLADPALRNSVLLVSSEAWGEGRFVAELAALEKRPGHVVLRATKVLARSWWSGEGYRLLYSTAPEVMAFLDEIPVGLLVVDMTPGRRDMEHHRLLQETVRDYPERWELMGEYPRATAGIGPGSRILVYRLAGHERRPVGKIRINMEQRLGKVIGN